MKNLLSLKSLKKNYRKRGQVFILATLIIVVYSVAMISVVTQLSINQTKTDTVDLPHMVNEYLTDMKYQLEIGLYDYVNNGASNDTVISNIQSFVNTFSQYASTKGIDTSINLRLNEFAIHATSTNGPFNPVGAGGLNDTMSISINSSILFQSSNSGSKISGIFIHYFAINVLISSSNLNALILTEKDSFGNTLKYISGASFTSPTGVIDNSNGTYTYNPSLGVSFAGSQLSISLPSGLEFFS